jgi:transcriptional regulator with XRE-family HTH domain
MAEIEIAAPDVTYYTAHAERRELTMITSEQVRAARALLRWDQKDLAKASGLAEVTIRSIEQRPGALMVRSSSLYALERAFSNAGVIFFDSDNGGAGVRWKRGRR